MRREGNQCGFGHAGLFHHEPTGLDLATYRVYDASLGRWVSRDPLGEGAGLNLYVYCGGDPVNCVDPEGLIIRFDPKLSSSETARLSRMLNFLRGTKTGREIVVALDLHPSTVWITKDNLKEVYRETVERLNRQGKTFDPPIAECDVLFEDEDAPVIVRLDLVRMKYHPPAPNTTVQDPLLVLFHELAHAHQALYHKQDYIDASMATKRGERQWLSGMFRPPVEIYAVTWENRLRAELGRLPRNF